jgi:rod shape-determining protein MreD
MRRSSSAIGLVVLFAGLLVLHYSLGPLLGWRAPVDFLLIGVLLVSVRVRPGTAALLGCLAGIAADTLNPSSFGAAAIAMTCVGFAASWLKASFFDEHLALNALFLLLGKLAYDAVFLFAERRLSIGQVLAQLVVWSLLSAVLTAVVGLMVLVLFRPIIDVDAERA